MTWKRRTVLMPVFNEIDFDGRVQRCAAALGERFDVTVFCPDSGRSYRNSAFVTLAIRMPNMRRFKGLQHLYFWLRLWLVAAITRPDIVHAQDFFMALPGWVAARLAGAKLVYDAHELIVPEEGILQSRRDRFFYLTERWVVRRADLVIAANPERAEHMQNHYRLRNSPLAIANIPPAPKDGTTAGETTDRYILGPRLTNSRVRLVYQGDMNLERGIGKFVSAMKELEDGFELILVGGGPDVGRLARMAEEPGVKGKVALLGKVPRDQLNEILKACDIGIVTYPDKGLNNLLCAPNKVYEYAQAGIPMVANRNPTLEALFAKYHVGLASDNIAADIKRLLADIEAYKNNIPAFLEENNWDHEADKLNRAYSDLD